VKRLVKAWAWIPRGATLPVVAIILPGTKRVAAVLGFTEPGREVEAELIYDDGAPRKRAKRGAKR
jgi:hypothetical protein